MEGEGGLVGSVLSVCVPFSVRLQENTLGRAIYEVQYVCCRRTGHARRASARYPDRPALSYTHHTHEPHTYLDPQGFLAKVSELGRTQWQPQGRPACPGLGS